jgi:hypothetical protein
LIVDNQCFIFLTPEDKKATPTGGMAFRIPVPAGILHDHLSYSVFENAVAFSSEGQTKALGNALFFLEAHFRHIIFPG